MLSRTRLIVPPVPLPPVLARRKRLAGWAAVVAAGVISLVTGLILGGGSQPLLVATFPQGEKLITNERAHYDPHGAGVQVSPVWIATSGSLFSSGGAGWTGVPDDIAPDARSGNGNDSAVFRIITRQADFADVSVNFQLRIAGLVTTPRTPAQSYDGVHVFLRYQSPQRLYVVSVYRRDGVTAIKEKIPGGPANGGTYYTLAEGRTTMPRDRWVSVSVRIVTTGGNSVGIELFINGRRALATAGDRGRADPILAAGRVGIRGDNCQFFFRDFTVSAA